jgi:large subunit ribosomal protein L10
MKAEREKAIQTLEKAFGTAKGIYLTDIQKVNVRVMTKLRSDFRAKGVKYIVVKNTLAKIAVERSGKSNLVPYFQGPIGVAISSSDAVVPARIIRDFQKINKELLPLRAAFVEGSVFSGRDADRLADLPSKEVLLSQLLSCLKAPMANFVGSLSGILSKFVGTLEAVRRQKEKQDAN